METKKIPYTPEMKWHTNHWPDMKKLTVKEFNTLRIYNENLHQEGKIFDIFLKTRVVTQIKNLHLGRAAIRSIKNSIGEIMRYSINSLPDSYCKLVTGYDRKGTQTILKKAFPNVLWEAAGENLIFLKMEYTKPNGEEMKLIREIVRQAEAKKELDEKIKQQAQELENLNALLLQSGNKENIFNKFQLEFDK